MLNDTIYSGTIRHRRFAPKYHSFSYKLFMLCLNLDDIESSLKSLPYTSYEKLNWVSFKRKNYIGNISIKLDSHIKNLFKEKGVDTTNKSIFLISHLSFFGYNFNPISLYVLCDNMHIEAIIAEIHNTPWGEKHCYVLNTPVYAKPPIYRFEIKKELHVSPFMDMNFNYHFIFKITPNKLILHIQSMRNKMIYFDATLSMKGQILNKQNYLTHIKRHPLMTYKIIFAIYWQALLLLLKGVPFFSHPNKKI